MKFDAAKVVEGLLGDGGNGEPVSLDRAALEAALQDAFQRGRAEATFSADPDLESVLFRELMKSLPDYVYFKDRESRFIAVNPAHAEHFGKSRPAEVIGRSDFDFFEKENATEKFEAEQEILRTGRGFAPKVESHRTSRGEQLYVLTTKHPWYDQSGEIRGTFGHSRDITAAVVAEQELARQHRLLRTLIDAAPCRIFVRDRAHRFQILNEEYRRTLGMGGPEGVIGKTLAELVDHPPAIATQEEDEAIMCTGVPVLRRIEYELRTPGHGKWLSVSKVPLRNAEGEIEGIVGVAFDITPQKEAEARARLTSSELGRKNAQIESELAMARKLQVALATVGFPNQLVLKGGQRVSAAFLYEPSEHLAGDFFHLIPIDDQRFAVFICDVMGHGVRSALVTAMIRGLISSRREDLLQPARLFERINRILYTLANDPDFPRFVTASYSLFDIGSGQIECVNAGHPPLLYIRGGDREEAVRPIATPRDPAFGLVESFPYRSTLSELTRDCAYLFYTDGLIEQRSESDREFGLEGIRQALAGMVGSNPVSIVHRMHQALVKHAGRQTFNDDVCAMALHVAALDGAD